MTFRWEWTNYDVKVRMNIWLLGENEHMTFRWGRTCRKCHLASHIIHPRSTWNYSVCL